MSNKLQRSDVSFKILWVSVGVFAISGVLPWFVVQFPIGNLKISILDLMIYFMDNQGITVDFYSAVLYEIILIGWIFNLSFFVVSALLKKTTLILIMSTLTIVSGLIWVFIVPHLRIQMIFLSLSNQPIGTDQTMGSGEITAIVAGGMALYTFIRLKL
ncbi:MAG: hypothetical protein OER78_01695 [Nitrosopumilus sp.]|nr:hypothetical protein [Nitrosopumilus sp.]MDH3854915.1 hypothetical protein [Nitrosopumilus sp.]